MRTGYDEFILTVHLFAVGTAQIVVPGFIFVKKKKNKKKRFGIVPE